jgi:hypothetical protein
MNELILQLKFAKHQLYHQQVTIAALRNQVARRTILAVVSVASIFAILLTNIIN